MPRFRHIAPGARRRWVASVAAASITVLVVSGCSASKPAASSSSPAGSASGRSNAGSDAGSAKAALQTLLAQPTELPLTTPVGKPVPKGKTVAFISCASADCNQIAGLLKSQASLLGWTIKAINTDGSPQSTRKAFEQVVSMHAAGVISVTSDRSVYASLIPQLKANGTFNAVACGADPQGNGIDYTICGPSQTAPVGGAMATYMAADSDGKVNALYVNVPAFSTLTPIGTDFASTLKKYCPSCASSKLDLPVTALGTDSTTRIVSYLRAHPKVNYVGLSLDSLAIGLPAALKAAGLHVKIVGEGAAPTNLQYLASGDEAASVAFPYYEVYLSCLDAIVRHVAGADQIPSRYPRLWVLTKDNVKVSSNLQPVVVDSVSKFHALWGVAG
jgi:ABC-type sugar transport system substrate-binding protein